MGRIRTVKPELFKHLALFEAEEKYQLPLRIAFVGLFTCCDREGRFVWQPRRLKVEILPYDDVDISEVLSALLEGGFIKAYEVDGIIYGCIPTWDDHQYFNNKEAHSKLPDVRSGKILKDQIKQSDLAVHAKLSEESFLRMLKDNNMSSSRRIRIKHASMMNSEDQLDSEQLSLMQDQSESVPSEDQTKSKNADNQNSRVSHACLTGGSLKGRERNGREKERNINNAEKNSKRESPSPEALSVIFSHWQKAMKKPQSRLDKSRQKSIQSALAMGYSIAELCQAIDGCALTPFNMGQNDQGEPYNGLHIVFKSADQIDRFIHNAISPPQPANKSEHRLQSNAQAAQAWLSKQSPIPPAGVQ